MTTESESLRQTFIEESLEHLADIEQDLLAVEKAGAEIDEERVNKVFRAAHSIKGGAGFVGLSHIQRLSHKMENVLGRIRNRTLAPNPEIVNLLLTSSDALKAMILNPDQSEQMSIEPYVQGLDSIIEEGRKQPDALDIPENSGDRDQPEKNDRSLLAVGRQFALCPSELEQAGKEGKTIYLIRLANGQAGSPESVAFRENLEKYGTVFARHVAKSGIHLVFGCVLEAEDLMTMLDLDASDIVAVSSDAALPASIGVNEIPVESNFEKAELSIENEKIIDSRLGRFERVENQAKTDAVRDTTAEAPVSVRVKLATLDILMNMAGELVLNRNQLLQSIARKDMGRLETVGQRLDLITSELQETIMLTRMQPIGTLFKKFPRVVRDLSKMMGKEAQMRIEGESVELDRSLLEAISDPLTHLVRNAMDHGIESAADRKKSGKGETGTLSLRAFHRAGQVIVEVSDDGRGLDIEAIAATAVAKGFVTDEQVDAMSTREKMNLIFLAGFSTAESVSEVSGRGVGMDVVKTNLDRLGGQIEVESRSGMGMRFTIKLPLTLAIIPSQIVSVEGQRFAIAQVNLEELIRISPDQVKHRIELVGQARVVRLRDALLPVVRLADLLGIQRTYLTDDRKSRVPDRRKNLADRRSRKSPRGWVQTDHPIEKDERPEVKRRRHGDRRFHAAGGMNIAVVSTGSMSYGLVVDRFYDAEEIVVKPLGRHLKECLAYSGATIMGDGRVALILDVSGIARLAKLSAAKRNGKNQERPKTGENGAETANEPLNLLVFGGGADERFALPLKQVVRVEKIAYSAVQCIGGRRTVQYRGRDLPVFTIDQAAAVNPIDRTDRLLLIVFRIDGREAGLLATGPVESLVTGAAVDSETMRQPGISGSIILENRTTLLVEVGELIRCVYPDGFKDEKEKSENKGRAGSLLLAEDSNFFRTQISAFLRAHDFSVYEAENGQKAWHLIEKHWDRISIVVTDIEMPEMDGFGLAEKIRADSRSANLPILALTTLAEDEDIEKGRNAGIDEYQIKLDKDRLLDGIRRLIRQDQTV